jgi:hypothetical protein
VPSFSQLATTFLLGAFASGAIALGVWWSANEVSVLEHLEDSEATGPCIQLVSDEQDLGRVSQGSTLQVSFCVANTGTQPLELWHFRPENLDDKDSHADLIVAPGRVGELVVELNADTLFHTRMRRVRFRTNDPARPDLWLTIRGTVVPTVADAALGEPTR